MRNTRTCIGNSLATGKSGCQIDFGKIKAVILIAHGQTLGKTFSQGMFETLCHADKPNRIYPIKTIVEYAKNGGEPQTSAIGYGGTGVTGISAQTDTFTLDKFSEHLASSLTKSMNQDYDAYYLDENNLLIGVNNGTEELGGIPMSTVYPTVTAHPTSSAKATMTVSCCLADAQEAIENFDYVQLDWNPIEELVGLVPVDLVNTETTHYKLIETIGGYDRTEEFGQIIADNATTVLSGATTASYSDGVLTITASSGGTGVKMQAPSVLYANEIVGIEFNKTVAKS